MRHSSCTTIFLGVEDLEHQRVIRRHMALVVPAMSRVGLDVPRLEVFAPRDIFICVALRGRQVSCYTDEVRFLDCAGIADGERVARDFAMNAILWLVTSCSGSPIIRANAYGRQTFMIAHRVSASLILSSSSVKFSRRTCSAPTYEWSTCTKRAGTLAVRMTSSSFFPSQACWASSHLSERTRWEYGRT